MDYNNTITTLKNIYTKKYLALNFVLMGVYYILLVGIVKIQNGLMFALTPFPIIIALVITSSILGTIAIYSINQTRNNKAKVSASGLSFASIAGSMSACGCATTFPVLAIGAIAGPAGVSSFRGIIVPHDVGIVVAFVLLNLIIIVYYINKLSTPTCKIEKK